MMMEEHVSFSGQDTLTGLLVEFTVKACVGQLRVVHTVKNIHFTVTEYLDESSINVTF